MDAQEKPLGRDDLETVPHTDQYREEQLETETKPLHGKDRPAAADADKPCGDGI